MWHHLHEPGTLSNHNRWLFPPKRFGPNTNQTGTDQTGDYLCWELLFVVGGLMMNDDVPRYLEEEVRSVLDIVVSYQKIKSSKIQHQHPTRQAKWLLNSPGKRTGCETLNGHSHHHLNNINGGAADVDVSTLCWIHTQSYWSPSVSSYQENCFMGIISVVTRRWRIINHNKLKNKSNKLTAIRQHPNAPEPNMLAPADLEVPMCNVEAANSDLFLEAGESLLLVVTWMIFGHMHLRT